MPSTHYLLSKFYLPSPYHLQSPNHQPSPYYLPNTDLIFGRASGSPSGTLTRLSSSLVLPSPYYLPSTYYLPCQYYLPWVKIVCNSTFMLVQVMDLTLAMSHIIAIWSLILLLVMIDSWVKIIFNLMLGSRIWRARRRR